MLCCAGPGLGAPSRWGCTQQAHTNSENVHATYARACHPGCRCGAAGVTGCTEHTYRAHCGQPVSLASELLVVQTLAGACREQLGVLPTSLAEDVQLMQAAGGPAADEPAAEGACHDLAVRWRAGYKAALTSCAERCEALVAACLRCVV